jgi:hypothetical protein
MQAEVAVQQRRQELEQEKIKAEIVVTQATGLANSVKADADACSKRVKGEAEAAAISARAKALGENANLVALTQAERWNGALPATTIPGSTVPLIGVK